MKVKPSWILAALGQLIWLGCATNTPRSREANYPKNSAIIKMKTGQELTNDPAVLSPVAGRNRPNLEVPGYYESAPCDIGQPQMSEMIQKKMPPLMQCKPHQAQSIPTVVRISFQISGTGPVSNIRIATKPSQKNNLGVCVAQSVKSWTFPRLPNSCYPVLIVYNTTL